MSGEEGFLSPSPLRERNPSLLSPSLPTGEARIRLRARGGGTDGERDGERASVWGEKDEERRKRRDGRGGRGGEERGGEKWHI